MAILDVLEIFRLQKSRPVSVMMVIAALFAPVALTIFIEKPWLFAEIGVTGVLLISVSASLPILVLCFSIWYTPLKGIANVAQKLRSSEAGDGTETDLASEINKDDPFEWPSLLAGGSTANLVLYGLVVWAYFKPIRVGSSLVFIAAILLLLWLLVFAVTSVFVIWAEHKSKT